MGHEFIAKNLRRLRESRGLSQEAIAKAAGISRVGYRKIETQASIPRINTLKAITRALSISIQELVTPVNELVHVRFRSQRVFNTRSQVLAEISEKINNYNELEQILKKRIENKLEKIKIDHIDPGKRPQEVAAQVRKIFNLVPTEPIRNICSLLEANSIKVISIRRTSDNFFGLSVSTDDGGPAIVINTWERIAVERWIFTAAHELGHLVLHLNAYDVRQIAENDLEEKEANLFASYFLMPQELFSREWENTYGMPFADRVLKIKHIFRVSYKTVLYRLHQIYSGKNIWRLFYDSYHSKYKKSLHPKEEPEALEADAYLASFPESKKAKEPEDLSPRDFQGERLWALVRIGVESGKISLSRGAEILGLKLMEIRQLSRDWESRL